MCKQISILLASGIFLFSIVAAQTGTTNTDGKAKQLEEMRKLKNQMMDEQKNHPAAAGVECPNQPE